MFTKIFTKILTKQNHLQNRLQNRLQKRLQKHLQTYLQTYLQNQRSFKNAICLCSGHPKQSFEYHCRQSRYTFRGTFLLHTLGDVCVAMVVRTNSRRTEIHSVRSISQTPRARPTKLSPRKRVHFLWMGPNPPPHLTDSPPHLKVIDGKGTNIPFLWCSRRCFYGIGWVGLGTPAGRLSGWLAGLLAAGDWVRLGFLVGQLANTPK